jgi:predicted phage terminase large subunit-like protein
MALGKASRRFDLLFDPMKLSAALGYDFHLIAHGQELLNSVCPNILPIDAGSPSSDAIPLFDLPGSKNRLVLWSRGHFKTSAVVLRIVNLILAYPDIRILLMQATVRNTRGLLREIKSHFDGSNNRSMLVKDFPKWCRDVRLGTADGFVSPARQRTHLKEWTVGVASPKSVKAGQHYDAMFADDLVNETNFRSKELQEKAIEDFNHYTPLIEPGGIKTVTGTRYSFGDLYGHIIRTDAERREWEISVRTCWKENDRKNGVLFPQVKTEDNRTIGFTEELLGRIQKDDPATFSCQYLNQPIIAGQQKFTTDLLMRAVVTVPPSQIPTLGPAVLFLDLAASTREDSDNSVIICGRQHGGLMHVCDVRAGKFSPFQSAHNTIDMVLRHRPVQVMIENTAAGMVFIEYLRVIAASKGIFIPIEPIKVTNNKDAKNLRISCIEGALKAGHLRFLAGLPGWEEIIEQFLEFPRGRHDDEIDTIALMVQFYTQNSPVFMTRPKQTLTQYITQPQPLSDLVQNQFESSDDESCGSDFA